MRKLWKFAAETAAIAVAYIVLDTYVLDKYDIGEAASFGIIAAMVVLGSIVSNLVTRAIAKHRNRRLAGKAANGVG